MRDVYSKPFLLKTLLIWQTSQSGVGGLPLLTLPSLQGMDAVVRGQSLDAANTGTAGIALMLEDTTNECACS